jgi:sugar lactone lactonase YvrE
MTADVVIRGTDALGECPLWHEVEQALYWVDARAPALYRWQPDGERHAWPLPEIVGSFAFRQSGGLLVALQTGIFTLDLESAALSVFARPEDGKPNNRFNDGRADRQGRFWVGTMSAVSREPEGSLYRLAPDGGSERLFNDIVVPNSIAWSPDSTRMYFADTYRQRIWTFDYDLETGAIGHRQLFSDLTHARGRPDGSAVDADGGLWNCEYAGGRVVRYAPGGVIDQVIEIPVDNPTCCAFGGRDLRTLYITSARQRLTPEDLARQPLAGSVFAVHTAVSGLPEARFGG